MSKRFLLPLLTVLPALSTELPPAIPAGPVEYNDISYDASFNEYYDAPYTTGVNAQAPTPVSNSTNRGYINLNAYSSNYQVRGMGVNNELSKYGYSSVSGSFTLPVYALSTYGLQHRLSGEYGVIWDATCRLGDTPVARLSYGLGKEIFPNLIAEAGYTFRHGGLEGYMASEFDGASHRATQELYASISFNDHQRGFFGKMETGLGFYGLTGLYFDFEAGYRFTDIMQRGNMGIDMELSAGAAPSIGYWGSDVEGSDAYRIRLALLPYSQSGSFGRDARAYVKPWIQCSWSGSNAAKIDRAAKGTSPIDHFQITLGVDCGINF